MGHSSLKIIQFHQYQQQDILEVEQFDDHGLLTHGGGDGTLIPEHVDTPGPVIESVDGMDGTDVPVLDNGADFDMDDDTFWQKWYEEIRQDEFSFVGLYGGEPDGHACDQVGGSCRELLW